jgi:hypothetical protein
VPCHPDYSATSLPYHRPRRAAEAYLRLDRLGGEDRSSIGGHFGHLVIGRARRPFAEFKTNLRRERQLEGIARRPMAFTRGHRPRPLPRRWGSAARRYTDCWWQPKHGSIMISEETKIGRVMLLQRGKIERKVIETELGDRKPKYGETITLPIDGNQVRARVTAVWRPPPLAG